MNTSLNHEEALTDLLTIKDLLRWTISQLNQNELTYGHGTENSHDEALNLILGSLHLPYDVDETFLSAKLTFSEKKMIVERVQDRIINHTPVPYLVNAAWFGDLEIYVDKRVIIPRSPIAELIQDKFNPWIAQDKVNNVLDLCTGSGCIAILAAIHFPDAQVDAVELSKDAIAVAKINVSRFELESQLKIFNSDLFNQLPDKKYDIIVSNPPYVDSEDYTDLPLEYLHEPKQALVASDEGLGLVIEILKHASKYLTPHGILIVEVGYLSDVLEARFPNIPFTWLQFEQGGEGVFLLTAKEINEFKMTFES